MRWPMLVKKSLLFTSSFVLMLQLAPSAAGVELESNQLDFTSFREAKGETAALVAKVIEGLGGESLLRGIGTFRKVAVIDQKLEDRSIRLEFDGTAVLPGSLHARLKSPAREMTAVATPEFAHTIKSDAPIQGAAIRMSDHEKKTFLQFFYGHPLLVLRNTIGAGYPIAWGGTTKVDSRDTEVLVVVADGTEIRWYVDSATGRVIRTSFDGNVTKLDDWRPVQGITMPFQETRFREGEEVARVTLQAYAINPPVDSAALFAKPKYWMTRKPLHGRQQTTTYYNRYSYDYYLIILVP